MTKPEAECTHKSKQRKKDKRGRNAEESKEGEVDELRSKPIR